MYKIALVLFIWNIRTIMGNGFSKKGMSYQVQKRSELDSENAYMYRLQGTNVNVKNLNAVLTFLSKFSTKHAFYAV